MNKKFFSKLLVIILLLIIVINNISYAVNIEKEEYKKSLKHIFASDIKLKTEVRDTGINGSTSLTYRAPSELEISDTQVILREVGEVDGERAEISLVIDYSIDEKNATFKMRTDVMEYLKYEPEDEIAAGIIALLMAHMECMNMGYLVLADNLNMNMNVVATYFDQCAAKVDIQNLPEDAKGYNVYVPCDLFLKKIKFDEVNNIMEASMEINLEEFSKINESLIEDNIKTTVEFLKEYKEDGTTEENPNNNNTSNENVNNTTNDTTNNTVNNTTNNTVNNTTNNTTNNTVNKANNNIVNNTANNVANKTANKVNKVTNQNTKPADNTTSNIKIPAAGSETFYYIIASMVTISLLIYIKLRKYDDVK